MSRYSSFPKCYFLEVSSLMLLHYPKLMVSQIYLTLSSSAVPLLELDLISNLPHIPLPLPLPNIILRNVDRNQPLPNPARSLNSKTPFLKAKAPTETIHDPKQFYKLPDAEKWVLHFKKQWLATPYPKQLADIISRVIEDRTDESICNVVCLGMTGTSSTARSSAIRGVLTNCGAIGNY